MSDYGDVHRKHMQMALEHEDKEWKRLNVKDISKSKMALFWAFAIGLTLSGMVGFIWLIR